MTIADAAFTILSRAGGGPLHLSDLLARIQMEGLAELRGQTPQLSLASILLRDERFHNRGRNSWMLAAAATAADAADDLELPAVLPEPPTRSPKIYAEETARCWRIHFPRELWENARRHGVIAIGWPLDAQNQSVKRFHQIRAGDRVVAYVQGGVIGGIGVVTSPFDPERPRADCAATTLGDEFTQYLRVAWADAPAEPQNLLEALRHANYTHLYNRIKNPHTVMPLSRDDYHTLLSLLQVDDAGEPRSASRLPTGWEQLAPYLSLARGMGDTELTAEQLLARAQASDPPLSAALDADDLVAELLQLRLIMSAGPKNYRSRPYVNGDETALLRLCALALLAPVEGAVEQYLLPAQAILPRLAATETPQPVEHFAPELGEADAIRLVGWYAEAGLVTVDGDAWLPSLPDLTLAEATDPASLAYAHLFTTLQDERSGTFSSDLAHLATDAALPPVEAFEERMDELGQELLFDHAVIRRIYRSLLAGRHVVLSGPPGTGKTELARRLPSLLWREAPITFQRLTFSPDLPPLEQVTEQRHGYAALVVTATEDWGVRDVVGGIGPRLDSTSGALSYTIEHGVLTRVLLQHYQDTERGRRLPPPASGFLRRDRHHEGRRYRGIWLVIDEFTRAPIDAAFGSLLTTLSGGQQATLAVPTREGELREVPLPRDFRIIGTLNSFDRHFLNQISEAMKRRFDFIDVLPPSPADAIFEQGIALKEALRRMRDDGFAAIEQHDAAGGFRWPGVLRVEPITDAHKPRRYQWQAETPEVATVLESFWRIFSAIRVFRQLGTAQVVAVYLNVLTGVRVGMPWDEALDTALADGLADQLQVLSRDEQRTLDALLEHAGQPGEFAAAVQAIVRELPPGRRAGYLYALRERDTAIHGTSDLAVREETLLSAAQLGRVFLSDVALALPPSGAFRRRLRDLIGERGL
ncbi:AAA family ATPase [Candidatus Chloroploca sp. M-50]|uniref:AAA family ATPase n=1 Tax=Candidatus Chloroploca mongolica TaxID=2528176 RepID=A0ABS4D9P6_9CHLR|nr:AAA family ATPase [Candidatus Chloroploca mongolica]MBP1466161.1 AAA family ATPase [Candidatus Chloroploca mongolica]